MYKVLLGCDLSFYRLMRKCPTPQGACERLQRVGPDLLRRVGRCLFAHDVFIHEFRICLTVCAGANGVGEDLGSL